MKKQEECEKIELQLNVVWKRIKIIANGQKDLDKILKDNEIVINEEIQETIDTINTKLIEEKEIANNLLHKLKELKY